MTYFGLFLPSEGLEYSAYTLLIWCFLANEYLFCISFKNTKKCIHVWMARGWANNAIIFIFGWTIPLNWIIARIVLHYYLHHCSECTRKCLLSSSLKTLVYFFRCCSYFSKGKNIWNMLEPVCGIVLVCKYEVSLIGEDVFVYNGCLT